MATPPLDGKTETTFSYKTLWQAILEHRPADAVSLCRPQTNPNRQVDPVVSRLIHGLVTPSFLQAILVEFAETEQRATGWRALFFGLARLILGQGSAALWLFKTAYKTVPCRVPALVHLAGFYLARHDRSMAEKLLQEGFSKSGQVGEFNVLKARLFLLDKAFDQARDQVETARTVGCYSPLSLTRYKLELLMARDEQKKAIEGAVQLLVNGLDGVNKEGIAAVGLGVLTTCGALDEADNYLDQALENDPPNIILLTHRSDIATLRGRFRVAAAAIQRVLAQDENNIDLLHKKACLAGQGFSYKQGFEALDKVMELARDLPPPIRAAYMTGYGDIYFDQDKPNEAETAYREALAVDEKCLPALGGLSRVLTSLGRMDDAMAVQDTVYRIAPVQAMQMMISTDRIPEGNAEIRRMTQMADHPSVSLQMRATLNLSLAKVWQNRKDHNRAMAYADKANEITRAYISYDHQQAARQTDRIITRMSKAFFENRRGFGSNCDLPVYILGMPRSGTTLVEQIVGGHSKVFPGGELGIISTMWGRLMVWEHRLGSDYQHIPDCSMELTRYLSLKFAQKVEGEYRELIPEGEAQVHITDKLPHNFRNIGLIKLLFPKARIIYCRRSPGGIALSNYFTDYKARHGTMGYAYNKKWIGSEIANCQRLMSHWIDLFGNEIHLINYEELVMDPKTTVQTLLAYLELEWEDRVLDFPSLNRPVKTASMTQVRQPMYTGSKERWRHYADSLQPVFDALEVRKAQDLPAPPRLPKHEPGLFLKGMDLLQSGKAEEAEAVFKTILEMYPRHAAAMHMLGATYSMRGTIQPAYECMKRSIQLHPNNHTWYENLAIVLDHMHRPEEAKNIRRQGKKFSRKNTYLPDENFSH